MRRILILDKATVIILDNKVWGGAGREVVFKDKKSQLTNSIHFSIMVHKSKFLFMFSIPPTKKCWDFNDFKKKKTFSSNMISNKNYGFDHL